MKRLSEQGATGETTSRIDREREFHDRSFAENLRSKNDRFYDVATGSQDWHRELLARHSPDQRILEYGCGDNPLGSLFLAARGAEVTAVDLSPIAIERSRDAARRQGSRT